MSVEPELELSHRLINAGMKLFMEHNHCSLLLIYQPEMKCGTVLECLWDTQKSLLQHHSFQESHWGSGWAGNAWTQGGDVVLEFSNGSRTHQHLLQCLKKDFDVSCTLKTRFIMSDVWQTAIVRPRTYSSFCNGRNCCFPQDISAYSFTWYDWVLFVKYIYMHVYMNNDWE